MLEVTYSAFEIRNTVTHKSKRSITVTTKKTSNLSRNMIMIYGKITFLCIVVGDFLMSAYCALTTLLFVKCVIFLKCHTELKFQNFLQEVK